MRNCKSGVKKTVGLVLILALFFVCAITAFAEDSFRAATVHSVSGDVRIMKAGGEKSFAAFEGMSLTEGDRIITGKDGKASLYIDDDKEVIIDSNSQINLSELKGTVKAGNDQTGLNLLVGKVLTNIKNKLNIRAKFEIKTPTAVMGVRGTYFAVESSTAGTDVQVLEGVVGATAYRIESRPGETPGQRTFEIVVTSNQQVKLDDTVQAPENATVQPVAQQDLELFILQDIVKNPDRVDPSLLNQIQQVIEQKQQEQQQLQQQQQQDEQNQGAQNGVSYMDEMPGAGNSGGGNHVPIIAAGAIAGLVVPAAGGTPVGAVAETVSYTGTVTWSPPGTTFGYNTVYTATITLTPKTGYTLKGVTVNCFTVPGASSVTNSADSGTITAVFPKTAMPPVINYIDAYYLFGISGYINVNAALDCADADSIFFDVHYKYDDGTTYDVGSFPEDEPQASDSDIRYFRFRVPTSQLQGSDSYMRPDGEYTYVLNTYKNGSEDPTHTYTGTIPVIQNINVYSEGNNLRVDGNLYGADQFRIRLEKDDQNYSDQSYPENDSLAKGWSKPGDKDYIDGVDDYALFYPGNGDNGILSGIPSGIYDVVLYFKDEHNYSSYFGTVIGYIYVYDDGEITVAPKYPLPTT